MSFEEDSKERAFAYIRSKMESVDTDVPVKITAKQGVKAVNIAVNDFKQLVRESIIRYARANKTKDKRILNMLFNLSMELGIRNKEFDKKFERLGL